MLRSVSTWHIAAAITLLAPGCFLTHDRGATPVPEPEPVPVPSPSPSPEPAPPGGDAGAPRDACSEIVARIRAGERPESIGCGRGFAPVDCRVPIGECCVAEIGCAIEPTDGARVSVVVSCLDSCEQGCAAQAREDCAFFASCEWFDEGACGEGPAGVIAGPVCAPRRAGPCDREGRCAEGLTCRGYWVNPCAGALCDACGGEQDFCAP